MKKNTIIFLLAIITVALMLLQFRTCNKVSNTQKLYEAVSDTLTTYRNERGLVESYIDLIETESQKDFLKLHTQDSTIKWLKNTIKSYNGKLNTGIVANTNTTSEGGLETITVTQYDTVIIDSVKYIYPEYAVDWTNEWEIGSIRANRDSIFRNISVKNKYEITIGKQKNGWFKKREQVVKLLNLNPNTTTSELRAFNIKSNPKRLGISLQVGYGITTALGTTPYAGIGLSYMVIHIK